MKWEDKERRALIDRLKKVRDPRERDRIMQVLASHELGAPGRTSQAEAGPEAAEPAAGTERAKAPPKAAGLMLGLIVPGSFIAFGLMYIVNALIRLTSGQGDHDAMVQLVMGGVFLIFGFAGFVKARRMRKTAEGEPGGAPPAKKPGIWKRS